jgi:hypothetical protein
MWILRNVDGQYICNNIINGCNRWELTPDVRLAFRFLGKHHAMTVAQLELSCFDLKPVGMEPENDSRDLMHQIAKMANVELAGINRMVLVLEPFSPPQLYIKTFVNSKVLQPVNLKPIEADVLVSDDCTVTVVPPAMLDESSAVLKAELPKYCTCWLSDNTMPDGSCRNCGRMPSPERLKG